MTVLAYRFALDPTPAQERALRSHAGAARVAFNWGLARVKANLSQREAEKSYGITGDDLTPSLSWSLHSLRKDWNAAKAQLAPWWAECSKEASNTGLDQLARALTNWAGSRKGKRKGRPVGFPRFKAKRKAPPLDPLDHRVVPVRGPARGPAPGRAGHAPRGRPAADRPGGGRDGAGHGRVRAVRAGPLARGVHRRAARPPPRGGRPGHGRRGRPGHQGAGRGVDR